MNILDNAFKYSPSGSLIEIKGWTTDKEISIEIADRGIGIPPQDLEHIFDKFYRVHRPEKITGTGLGLIDRTGESLRPMAVVLRRKIVRVVEQSSGSHFRLLNRQQRVADKRMGEKRPFILIVDDEEAIRQFLGVTLTSQGYEIVEAASGQEALSKASSRHPDLIILDLVLPDIDGVEITRRLRQWTQIPIINISR